jgi:hypothetical protein
MTITGCVMNRDETHVFRGIRGFRGLLVGSLRQE